MGVAAKAGGCEATDNHHPSPFHASSGASCGCQLAPEPRDLARRCRARGWSWGGNVGVVRQVGDVSVCMTVLWVEYVE